jgi:hypothetical protein
MRLEGQDAGLDSKLGGGLAHMTEQGLMAAVHPIKIADGERTGLALVGRRKAAKDLHAWQCKTRKDKASGRVTAARVLDFARPSDGSP